MTSAASESRAGAHLAHTQKSLRRLPHHRPHHVHGHRDSGRRLGGPAERISCSPIVWEELHLMAGNAGECR